MEFKELKERALSLPLAPGVYLMKDKSDAVIYVGKAKKLKNRVSQYFQDTASHSSKTRVMISKIDHFDVIVAASEFEALILECSLIKKHQPKYNILLKDDKGYPFLRLETNSAYPRIKIVNTVLDDGASYFGPFGSRGVSQSLLKTINRSLKLPDCNRKFPNDIGKERPCLNYHMNLCDGWCQANKTAEEYCAVIEQARQLLLGNYKSVGDEIRKQMLSASEQMHFELAASLRDRLIAVENLGRKQLVTAVTTADTDVIGFGQTEAKSCFAVLHFSNGNLLDKDCIFLSSAEETEIAVPSLLKQYYLSRGFSPKIILLPIDIEDRELFEELLSKKYSKKVRIRIPKRGDGLKLVELAIKNAQEEAERITNRETRLHGTLTILGKMLAIPTPYRIESFDISNISGTDNVAGMVVFIDGKPKSSEYKRFKVNEISRQDDYASMAAAVRRRFQRFKHGDAGFEAMPDLLLIDGGVNHAKAAEMILQELNLSVPVFGMVKDNRHRTRALVTSQGMEIAISNQQAVFSLIGNIQEETHRFAIGYHKKLRNKRLRYSELDTIPGIGQKRKQELLRVFKSLNAISSADIVELERLLPKETALAVYQHFEKKRKEK